MSFLKTGWLTLLVLFFGANSFAKDNDAAIGEFLSQQKIIRILADDASGYGMQVVSQTLMLKLRNLGFAGKFEFIYPANIADKISLLFDLPNHLPAVYVDAEHEIEFIRLSKFMQRHKNKTVEKLTLGMSGGLTTDPGGLAYRDNIDILHGMDILDYHNHANFMNVQIFAQLTTFYKYNSFVYVADDIDAKHALLKNSVNTFLPQSYAAISDVKNYLQQTAEGKTIVNEKKALLSFMQGMLEKKYNVLPVYANTLKTNCKNIKNSQGCYPGNLLQVIAAARYAQLHGSRAYHKPLVISVYYDFEQEANTMLQLINSNDWGQYEINGAQQARNIMQTLKLKQSFTIGSIYDTATIQQLAQLKQDEILFLWLGPFPKLVFDGLFNFTNSNIWPQIREGNNAFATLIETGKPHLRCGETWELEQLKMADPNVKMVFADLYQKNGICRGMTTWEKQPDMYRKMGEFLIAADSDGSLRKYFAEVKEFVMSPANDRLKVTLLAVIDKIKPAA